MKCSTEQITLRSIGVIISEIGPVIVEKNHQFSFGSKNYRLNILLNPGAASAGSGSHFRLLSFILRDTEVIATNAFFKNSGQRFRTNNTIQNMNYMKDKVTIKNNQRHKYSNFRAP